MSIRSATIFKALLWILLCVCSLNSTSRAQPASASPERLDWILKQYQAAIEKLNSLQADLTLVKTNKLLDLSETVRATLKMKRPRKLLLDTREPTPSKKIINGDVAWIYEPELNQAQKFDISHSNREMRDVNPLELAYRGKIDELKRRYEISLVREETFEDKTFYHLLLKLKAEETESRYATIHLKMQEGQWIPVEIKTTDESGEVEELYTLTAIKLNAPISDLEFEFTPPKGVEVVEPQKE